MVIDTSAILCLLFDEAAAASVAAAIDAGAPRLLFGGKSARGVDRG